MLHCLDSRQGLLSSFLLDQSLEIDYSMWFATNITIFPNSGMFSSVLSCSCVKNKKASHTDIMKLVRRFIKALKTLVFLFLTQFFKKKIFSITGSSRFRRISFALRPSSQLSGHGVASSEENDEEASRNSQPTLRASRFKWSFGWILRGKEITLIKVKI